jgi:hypothetical protein
MNKSTEIQGWLSVATLPFLLGYLGLRLGAKALQELGEASEEIFRGDRLPILPLHSEENP